MTDARNVQDVMLVAYAADDAPSARVAQYAALVTVAPPFSIRTFATQVTGLGSTIAPADARVSAVAGLAAYKTGPLENLTVDAWAFDFDGHTFYVLNLGDEGTFVYDLLTDTWSQFKTEGLPVWNMQAGLTWNKQVVALDQGNPTIWYLDPSSALDDGIKPITRVATGGLPARNRNFIPNGAFRITISGGVPTEDPATVTLEISDDAGNTFSNVGSQPLVTGDFKPDISWLSLGAISQPGRIYRITDTGGFFRLDGADAELEGSPQ
jgi:hypothetical protein